MRWIFPRFVSGPGAFGLLALRVVTGLAFVLHGWGKLQAGPFQWMGPDGPPGPIQALAVLAEFGGGIALVLGLLTPVAAILIAGTMVGALAMVHVPAGHPFVSPNPEKHSFELALGYLVQMILFLLLGPGVLSIDALWFAKKKSSVSPS
jgi:putative oxidoreductase